MWPAAILSSQPIKQSVDIQGGLLTHPFIHCFFPFHPRSIISCNPSCNAHHTQTYARTCISYTLTNNNSFSRRIVNSCRITPYIHIWSRVHIQIYLTTLSTLFFCIFFLCLLNFLSRLVQFLLSYTHYVRQQWWRNEMLCKLIIRHTYYVIILKLYRKNKRRGR